MGPTGNDGAPDAGGPSDDASRTPPPDNTEAAVGADSATGTDGPAAGVDGSAAGTEDAAADSASGDSGTIVTDPGTMGDGTSMIAAPFTAAPEMSDKAGVPKGKVVRFQMGNSKTFGDGGRAVGVYVPAGYVSGTEIPFIVAQDGIAPQNGGSFGLDDLRPLLDNMIADGRLPMMAGIFADPAGQRSVEYDTASDKYYQFVETELLPQSIAQVMMQGSVVLNLTKNPEGRATFGGSSGGAAAFTMGWFHPESYRRILTLSGSFVTLQRSPPDFPNGCADYHMTAIANTTPPKPLRVFLESGSNDIGGWRAANDAMSKALGAKAYHYRYIQAQGASHEDDGARRQYLPEAMLWLWRGYPIKP
jgi:enterochelin esterase-like enzyme